MPDAPGPDQLVSMYAAMLRVRRCEERARRPMRGGVGAWLAWVVMEDALDELDAPIVRVAAPNVPVPFSPPLEAAVTPGAAEIVRAVRRVLA